jgi:DNA-nicking Smr family endonuclease
MSGGRRKRILTGDEMALWSHVTRHVAPMPGRLPLALPEPEPTPAPAPAPAKAPTPNAARPKPPAAVPPPPIEPLDRRLRQRLARGQHPVDAVIDLHGMRQEEAHHALRGFLHRAQAGGARVVLVVTGKGGSAAAPAGLFEERGVLRRVVPHWLRMPDLRPLVIGFEEAAVQHGGTGALYVRIRRRGGGGP